MKLEQAAPQALGALVRAEAMYGQPNADIQTALRDALAEPELNLNCKSVQKRLATVWGYVKAEQAEQEPVCKRCNGTKIVPDGKMYSVDGFQLEVPIECVKDCPDCTAPVRIKDLTDDEIADIVYEMNGNEPTAPFWRDLARSVIAAYKEKNK